MCCFSFRGAILDEKRRYAQIGFHRRLRPPRGGLHPAPPVSRNPEKLPRTHDPSPGLPLSGRAPARGARLSDRRPLSGRLCLGPRHLRRRRGGLDRPVPGRPESPQHPGRTEHPRGYASLSARASVRRLFHGNGNRRLPGRNTGGIVIAAKTAEALRILNEKIRSRELDKRYLCAVLGMPRPPEGTLTGFLFKDAEKNRVYVRSSPEPGARTAVTEYRTLTCRGRICEVCNRH